MRDSLEDEQQQGPDVVTRLVAEAGRHFTDQECRDNAYMRQKIHISPSALTNASRSRGRMPASRVVSMNYIFMAKRGCRLSFHALFLYVGKIETLPRAHFWYLLRVKNEFASEGNAMSSPSQVGN